MPDINFPSSPSLNDTYTFNDITYTWDGEKWTAYSTLIAGSANYSDNQVDIHLNQSNPTDGYVLSWTGGDYAWVAQSGGGGSAQTLTLNSTAGNLSISGGNAVDLRQTQFLYSSSSDLPSASTYHGAIAHVHSEGALYFAHSGSWNKLANDDDAVKPGNETTFTNDIKFNTGVEEKFSTLTSQSGTVTHDCNNGHVFYHTSPAGDITANFTNLGLTAEYTTNITIVINQGATAREVTAIQIGGLSTTINWQGGSAPTGTANGIDAFSFTILNDGGSYVVLGQMVDFT